ncbi:MAG: hypothetical protein AB1752_06825 [Candidatus Zixiibacteriota bacterium]
MRTAALLLSVCLLMAAPAAAEDDGTQSPFRFGFGARDLSLGGADVSGCDFSTAAFWNASRLAQAPKAQISLFHANLFESDVNYDYAGIVWPTLDFGSVGIGIARLGVGGIERRDAGNVLLGELSDERLGLYLGYGRTIAGYDLGLTITMEHHQVDRYSATSSPGLDLSVTRRFPMSLGWFRGASFSLDGGNLLNPTTDLVAETVRYPRRYAGSASVDLRPGKASVHSIRLSARLEGSIRNEARSAFGAEYSMGQSLQLRGGLRNGDLSVGAGIAVRSVRLDYGLVGRDLGSVHMFTLSTAFGPTVSERKRHRSERQEQEFQRVMARQLQDQNSTLIDNLIAEGDSALSAGAHEEALRRFDRALFLVRTNGSDTNAVAAKLETALARVRADEREHRYANLVDSATAAYRTNEFLGARYYAELAMREKPEGDSAGILRDLAVVALETITARDQFISERLRTIDSMQAMGDNANALAAAQALDQYTPGNSNIAALLRRIRFEMFRSLAIRRHAEGKTSLAQAALDSASMLYPRHQWCEDFTGQLHAARQRRDTPPPTPAVSQPVKLSRELAAETEAAYRGGRSAFEAGRLQEAIEQWEQVERVAPGYESVRDYLIKAYRLVGVELYGQNDLQAALAMWRNAERLDPANSEIRAFIARAEAELGRLKELSYDQ